MIVTTTTNSSEFPAILNYMLISTMGISVLILSVVGCACCRAFWKRHSWKKWGHESITVVANTSSSKTIIRRDYYKNHHQKKAKSKQQDKVENGQSPKEKIVDDIQQQVHLDQESHDMDENVHKRIDDYAHAVTDFASRNDPAYVTLSLELDDPFEKCTMAERIDDKAEK